MDHQCYSSIRSCCAHDKLQAYVFFKFNFKHVKLIKQKTKSNSQKQFRLIDGKAHTHWQTTNAEKCESHWILITLKENIQLTSLEIFSSGNRNDEFLRTVVIEVRAGFVNTTGANKASSSASIAATSSTTCERVLAKCDYTQTINNYYTICTNECFASVSGESATPQQQQQQQQQQKQQPRMVYLKLVFRRQGEKNFWGKSNDQIKIRSLRLVGKRMYHKTQTRVTVQDASVCWYFEMLSAVTLVQAQMVPELVARILQISKQVQLSLCLYFNRAKSTS